VKRWEVNKVKDQKLNFLMSRGGKSNRGFAAFKQKSEINVGRAALQ
jgi:hypothetical protein